MADTSYDAGQTKDASAFDADLIIQAAGTDILSQLAEAVRVFGVMVSLTITPYDDDDPDE